MLIICPIAGVGSRLFPITADKQKAMLKVAGKRIIDYLMEKIGKIAPKGSRICFVVGYCKEQLIDYLQINYQSQYNLTFIEQNPIGTKNNYPFYSGLGDAIALTAEYGRNEDCFIILPDRYPLEDYTNMISTAIEKNLDGCINTQKVDNPQHYGIILPKAEKIIEKIVEKPKKYISNIAVSGAYYFRKNLTSELFEKLEKQANQAINDLEEHHFTSVIQELVDEGGKLGYNLMNRPVLDFGRPDTLLQANRVLIDEQHNTSKVTGHSCKLINSSIGDYVSIGNNTTLEDCIVHNSIIGDDCNLKGLSLNNVIIDNDSTNDNFKDRMIQSLFIK